MKCLTGWPEETEWSLRWYSIVNKRRLCCWALRYYSTYVFNAVTFCTSILKIWYREDIFNKYIHIYIPWMLLWIDISIDFSINGLRAENHLRPQRTPKPYNIKENNYIYRFGDKNLVTSSNFNATILEFSEKFDLPFSHDFIFANIFPERHGFVVMRVTSCIIDSYSNFSPDN